MLAVYAAESSYTTNANSQLSDLIFHNTAQYDINLDKAWSCCGSQIVFTMEFYKGIIGK